MTYGGHVASSVACYVWTEDMECNQKEKYINHSGWQTNVNVILVNLAGQDSRIMPCKTRFLRKLQLMRFTPSSHLLFLLLQFHPVVDLIRVVGLSQRWEQFKEEGREGGGGVLEVGQDGQECFGAASGWSVKVCVQPCSASCVLFSAPRRSFLRTWDR